MFGAFSVPVQAQAGFLSAIFGTNASAEDNAPDPAKINNSQNMVLLQANASSALDFHVKTSKDDEIKDNANVNILSDSALVPSTGLMGVSDGTDSADISSEDTSVYVVRKGDTVAAVAKMFDVSINTILWANDMKKGEKLVEGDILLILPIDGVNHVVVKGDTLKKIAKKYNADVSDIIAVNDVTLDSDIIIGQELIIPDAQMNDEGGDKPVSNIEVTTKKDQDYYIKNPIKNASGYYINPVPTGHKTQGIHDKGRAIDIGASTGTPIYAAASGTVIFAKAGTKSRYSNGGFGGLVILKHANGTETYYAHQSKIGTSVGQNIIQGQVIGYVGSTGHSTGPHLHFEVRGARNPGADWSWKK